MKRLTTTLILLALAAAAMGQNNPSYSDVTTQHPDAYLRPDALAGVRFQPDGPTKAKNMDAGKTGTRYPLDDPDIRYGILALPTQSWNKDTQQWDFRGLKYIIEDAISKGKRLYLRPFGAVQGTYTAVPEHFDTITQMSPAGSRTAVNVMDGDTFDRLRAYYEAFKVQIVDQYKQHIIGIDATWGGSIDGGQPSYIGHLGGGNLTSVFGFTQERLLEELQIQWDLWGEGMICHISPNTSDEWVTEWFAQKNCQARRQDSRPFRETRSTWEKAEKFNWSVVLDIYEITGGSLAAWTKTNGRWYPELVRFYGANYPQNVELAFQEVKQKHGFIWPMGSYPSRSQEPQYWEHYLEGPDGALQYIPGQIEDFYALWHDAEPPPTPDPDPEPLPDLEVRVSLLEAQMRALQQWIDAGNIIEETP